MGLVHMGGLVHEGARVHKRVGSRGAWVNKGLKGLKGEVGVRGAP